MKEAVINTFPSYEAFKIQDEIRKKNLHALDNLIELPSKPFEFSPSLSEDGQTDALKYYMFRYGHHPSMSLNIISPENMYKFSDGIVWHEAMKGRGFQKVEAKDRWSAEQLIEYYLNPLNAEYDSRNAEHIAFEENGKEHFITSRPFFRGYRNYANTPYITKTKVWPAGTEVEFLNICLGSGSLIQYKDWDNRCFAHQMTLTKNGKTNYHFVLNTEFFNPAKESIVNKWWSGTSWPKISLETTGDGLRVIVLTNTPTSNCTDERCWRKDFFSLEGQYLGSYNSLFSSKMVYEYKPINRPLILDTLGDLHLYMNTSPSWADDQIMKQRSSQ